MSKAPAQIVHAFDVTLAYRLEHVARHRLVARPGQDTVCKLEPVDVQADRASAAPPRTRDHGTQTALWRNLIPAPASEQAFERVGCRDRHSARQVAAYIRNVQLPAVAREHDSALFAALFDGNPQSARPLGVVLDQQQLA